MSAVPFSLCRPHPNSTPVSLRLDYDPSAEHRHPAGELVSPWFLRHELDRYLCALWELGALAEVSKDHLFGAGR